MERTWDKTSSTLQVTTKKTRADCPMILYHNIENTLSLDERRSGTKSWQHGRTYTVT